MDLAIRNGRVVTEAGVIDGGVAIDGSTIAFVGPDASLPRAARTIDAEGGYVVPGFIDSHVHLRGGRPGSHDEVYETTFRSESRGAVHGGVTTMGVFSWSEPGQGLAPGIASMRDRGRENSHVDFFSHAVVTREEHLAEFDQLAHEYGCWSFKHFFNANKKRFEGDGHSVYPGVEIPLMFQSLELVKGLGAPAIGMAHCEDQDLIWILEERLKSDGRADLRAWAEARPGWVEALRMRIAYEVARAVGVPMYVVHVAAAEGVELLREARRAGAPFWGETCPHYLTHTADMEAEIGCWGRVNTAIKFERDRGALWEGIRDGSISNMGTDHSSFARGIKEGGRGKHNNIWEARSGINGGLSHWLPVMMTFGVLAGQISIEQMVAVCSTNNARVFGLFPRKGVLRPGSDADIVIVDTDREVIVDDSFYKSGSDWSIYNGWRFQGLPRYTIVRGRVVLDEFEFASRAGDGTYLNPADVG